MADLPACRVTSNYKQFKFCGIDYFGPYTYRQNRSDCKAWRLLFTCLCTRGIHVELVTSLNLTSFCWHFRDLLISVGQSILSFRIMALLSVRQRNDFRRYWLLQSFIYPFAGVVLIGLRSPLMLLAREGVGRARWNSLKMRWGGSLKKSSQAFVNWISDLSYYKWSSAYLWRQSP